MSDWAKSLKVGDTVAVRISIGTRPYDYELCKIVKITPTGKINLTDGRQYVNLKCGNIGIGSTVTHEIVELTDETKDKIKRCDLHYKIKRNIDSIVKALTTEQLEQIINWVKEAQK